MGDSDGGDHTTDFQKILPPTAWANVANPGLRGLALGSTLPPTAWVELSKLQCTVKVWATSRAVDECGAESSHHRVRGNRCDNARRGIHDATMPLLQSSALT